MTLCITLSMHVRNCTCTYKANDMCDKMKSREGVIHYICCEMGLRAQHQTRILITIDRSLFTN